MLNRGVAPQSIWDALFVGAGELLVRQPGIVALHAGHLDQRLALRLGTPTANDDTRRMLLLQNAAFVSLFRQAMTDRGKIGDDPADQLQPAETDAKDPAASRKSSPTSGATTATAARKVLGYLDQGGDPQS